MLVKFLNKLDPLLFVQHLMRIEPVINKLMAESTHLSTRL